MNTYPTGMPAIIFGEPFEIYLAWSDVTLTVECNQTALQVLLAAGAPVSPGCQTGGCGECVTNFVEGDIIHKDSCLNADDRETTFCPCVSRAKTRVVLAL
ncbi:MAG: 2Fe-2S iron-sulfur cluster binding domain-containing protein [Hyphomicrobium sp.]|nr:2Fe-2S iron-sulfur cluster binding domain-containing protein [Hyphomicrobium sp.]